MRVLIPVLDSVNALPAVRYAIRESLNGERYEVQLQDVRSSFGRALEDWLTADPVRRAVELLERFRVPHVVRRIAGRDRAEAIVAAARSQGPDAIVLGAARYRSATRMSEDAVIEKLLDAAPVPVLVVTGKEVSQVERYGIAAGLGATLGLILLA
jgi:nucleotide-binding universal stress UspA family protein